MEYITLDYGSMINLKPTLQYLCSSAMAMESHSADELTLAGCSPGVRWVWHLWKGHSTLSGSFHLVRRNDPLLADGSECRGSCKRLKHVHPWQNSQTRKMKTVLPAVMEIHHDCFSSDLWALLSNAQRRKCTTTIATVCTERKENFILQFLQLTSHLNA